MKIIILALVLILSTLGAAQAGVVVIDWEASTGATSREVQQSADNGATWTVNAAVPTCSGTPLKCVATVTLPNTGLHLTRIVEKNSVGSIISYDKGVWHCQSCSPPTTPPKNIGIQ